MRLVKLVANNAWVFLFGDQLVPIDGGYVGGGRRFFETRQEAVAAAESAGLTVSRRGVVSSTNEEE